MGYNTRQVALAESYASVHVHIGLKIVSFDQMKVSVVQEYFEVNTYLSSLFGLVTVVDSTHSKVHLTINACNIVVIFYYSPFHMMMTLRRAYGHAS